MKTETTWHSTLEVLPTVNDAGEKEIVLIASSEGQLGLGEFNPHFGWHCQWWDRYNTPSYVAVDKWAKIPKP